MQCGNGLRIFHTGTSAMHMTRDCHLWRVTIAQGDKVKQGQIIGTVGDSGCRTCKQFTCSPHLHFEVLYDYRLVDPSTRIGGCHKAEGSGPTPNKPLVYPIRG